MMVARLPILREVSEAKGKALTLATVVKITAHLFGSAMLDALNDGVCDGCGLGRPCETSHTEHGAVSQPDDRLD